MTNQNSGKPNEPRGLSEMMNSLTVRFSMEDLRRICVCLEIDHEQFDNTNKIAFARELVQHCDRREMLDRLEECMPTVVKRQFIRKPTTRWAFIGLLVFFLCGFVLFSYILFQSYGDAIFLTEGEMTRRKVRLDLDATEAALRREQLIEVTLVVQEIIRPTAVAGAAGLSGTPLPDPLRDQVSSVRVSGGCALLVGSSTSAEQELRVCEDVPLLPLGWANHIKRVAADCDSGPGRIDVTVYLDGDYQGESLALSFCE